MPTKTPTSVPMSPAQAAQLKGVSRRTIMRAIESLDLQALRDNRNHWKIDPQALDKWADAQWALSEHVHPDAPTLPTPDLAISLARAEAERDVLREQLEQIKEDRDHWRRLAEQQLDLSKMDKRKGILARILGWS
jgi:excisionase family DNA binding protein